MAIKTKKNSLYATAILVVAASLFVFEQSPANEAVRAIVGFKVLDATGSALLAALTVGLITLAVEFSSSTLIALGLNHSRRFKKFSQRFSKNSQKDVSKNSTSDYLLALGIGAGTLVIKKHFQNKKQTLKADLKSAFKASLAITFFSAFVAFLASGGVGLAQQVGLETQAQYFLDVVTDWRFWLVVVIASQLYDLVKNRPKTT